MRAARRHVTQRVRRWCHFPPPPRVFRFGGKKQFRDAIASCKKFAALSLLAIFQGAFAAAGGRHENKLLASKYAAVGSSRQQHAIKCVFAAGISTRRVISRSICAGRRNLSLCFRKPPSPALLVSSSPRRQRKQGRGGRGEKITRAAKVRHSSWKASRWGVGGPVLAAVEFCRPRDVREELLRKRFPNSGRNCYLHFLNFQPTNRASPV